MSGIVGIIDRGEPVDEQILERMTTFLSFRGPDAQRVWIDGRVGFGHALLQTADDVSPDKQPLSLDGRVWITADARLDDRSRLVERLNLAQTGPDRGRTDAELILRAYLAWGDECTEHLLGDFTFAIWDGRVERLFCVRDPLGVKPFFYAVVNSGLVFSNTVGCLRRHPGVSDELNEQSVADFLLFGYNADPDSTAFAAIRRLPPAHSLAWTSSGIRIRRYWTMPVREPLRGRPLADCVERFGELLYTAVADRLRTSHVAISLSGGLDSSSVAATAQGVFANEGRPSGLRAWTTVFGAAIPDEERRYAGLVADALRIPISFQAVDRYAPFELRECRSICRPEPRTLFAAAWQFDRLKQAAAYSRVMLTGQGGDVILRPSASHLLETIRRLDFGQFAGDVWKYSGTYWRLPRFGVRTRLRQWLGTTPGHAPFPEWIDARLSARLNLKSRFAEVHGRSPESIDHHRPEAYQLLMSPLWSRLFESYDPESTGVAIEHRHPLFDLRLVDFALTIPTMPWCVDKALVREAMRGKLPEAVRRRPKTPLAGDPLRTWMKQPGGAWPRVAESPVLRQYVQPDHALRAAAGPGGRPRGGPNFRPFYLNLWLQSLQPAAELLRVQGEETEDALTTR